MAAQRRVTPANNRYKGAMTSPSCYTDTAATSITRRSNIPEAMYKGEALVSLTLQPPAAMLPTGAKAPQLLAFARSSHDKPPQGWYMGPCATQSRTPLLKPGTAEMKPHYPSSQGATTISRTTVRAEKPHQPTRKYVSTHTGIHTGPLALRVRSRTMLLLTRPCPFQEDKAAQWQSNHVTHWHKAVTHASVCVVEPYHPTPA